LFGSDQSGTLEVEDVRHTLDVEGSRGDVGGQQHKIRARAEVFDRRLSFLLRAIGVRRRRPDGSWPGGA
jgi:hypothetical protein